MLHKYYGGDRIKIQPVLFILLFKKNLKFKVVENSCTSYPVIGSSFMYLGQSQNALVDKYFRLMVAMFYDLFAR